MAHAKISNGRAALPQLRIACLSLAVALLATAARAQTDTPRSGTTAAPARAGNIYDHKAHQPMETDVCSGKDASLDCPSAQQRRQVEEEVQQLLRQSGTDIRGKQLELNKPR